MPYRLPHVEHNVFNGIVTQRGKELHAECCQKRDALVMECNQKNKTLHAHLKSQLLEEDHIAHAGGDETPNLRAISDQWTTRCIENHKENNAEIEALIVGFKAIIEGVEGKSIVRRKG